MRDQLEQVMPQAAAEDHPQVPLEDLDRWWQQSALQLDPWSNCRSIKIAGLVFHSLGVRGQEYWTTQASFILGSQAEFFSDAEYPDRYWLCVGEELIHNFGYSIERVPGKLPVLHQPMAYQPWVPIPPFQPLLEPQGPKGDPIPEAEVQPLAPELQLAQRHLDPLDPPAQAFQIDPQVGAYDFDFALPIAAPHYPLLPQNPLAFDDQNAADQNDNAEGQAVPQAAEEPAVEEAPEPAPRGRKRRAPDPNHIRRPRNAFIIFKNEIEAQTRRENPGRAFGERSKIVGARWQAMSPAERQPYNDKAGAEKAKHERLHPLFNWPVNKKKKRTARAKKNDEQEEGDEEE